VDTAGIDVILVGDSASNVMAGHETTFTDYFRSNDIPCLFSGQSD
jgi:ketopantoate hydroxymethyltransferase